MNVRKPTRTRINQCPLCIKDYTWKNTDRSNFIPKFPLLLDCNHAVCSGCVHFYVKSRKSFVKCPICHRETSRFGKLKTDIHMAGMSLAMAHCGSGMQDDSPYLSLGREMTDITVKCSNCYLANPDYRCDICSINVCHKCFYKIHPKSESRSPSPGPNPAHTPIRLNPLPPYKLIMTCLDHQRQLEYHCVDCDKYVCSKCVIEGPHKAHEVVGLNSKNDELADTVCRLRGEAGKTLQWLKKSKSTVLLMEPILKLKRDEKVLEIQTEFSRLHGMLQKREEKLIDEVKKKYHSDDTPLAKLKYDICQFMKKVSDLCEDARECFATDSQYFYDFTDLIKHLETVREIPCYLLNNPDDETDESKDEEIAFSLDVRTDRDNWFDGIGKLEGELKPRHRLVALNQIPTESLESIPESELLNSGESTSPIPSESEPSVSTTSTNPNMHIWKNDVVKVLQVVHPGNFFVIRLTKYRQLKELNQRIARFCSDGAEMFEDPPAINDFVLCRYSIDSNWYRAKIMKVNKPTKQVVLARDVNQQMFVDGEVTFEVFYIDYGNVETVRLSNLRKIHNSFLTIEEMGMKCALYEIVPRSDDGWSADAIALFSNLTSPASAAFHLQIFEQVGDVAYVDLRNEANERVTSVREFLVNAEVACFESNKSAPFSSTMLVETIDEFGPPRLPPESATAFVAVHHVNTPDSLFIQLMETAHEWRKMNAAMKSKYEIQQPRTIYCTEIGMPGVVLDATNVWQRVKLIRNLHRKKVELQLVDTGKIIIWDQSGLFHIDKEFVRLPPQAIECRLDDVAPTHGDIWPVDAKLFLTGQRKGRPPFKIFVKEVIDDKLSIVLYRIEEKFDLCINAKLVDVGLAESTGPNSEIVTIFRADVPPVQKADEPEKRKQSMQSALLAAIERPSLDSGFLDVDGIVSHAESPACLYFQADLDKGRDFEKFMDDVNKTYIKSIAEENAEWEVGDFCIVHAKAEWRRGKIVEIKGNQVQVFCYDYGNTENVYLNDLRSIKPRFFICPSFAVRCHLVSVKAAGDKDAWSSIACESLNEIIAEHHPFHLIQMGPEENGSIPVELYFEFISVSGALAPTVRESKSVGGMLVEKGFALPNRKEEKNVENVDKTITSGGDVTDPNVEKILTSGGDVTDPNVDKILTSGGDVTDPNVDKILTSGGDVVDPNVDKILTSVGDVVDPNYEKILTSGGNVMDPNFDKILTSGCDVIDPNVDKILTSGGDITDPNVGKILTSGGDVTDPNVDKILTSGGDVTDPNVDKILTSGSDVINPNIDKILLSGGDTSDSNFEKILISAGDVTDSSVSIISTDVQPAKISPKRRKMKKKKTDIKVNSIVAVESSIENLTEPLSSETKSDVESCSTKSDPPKRLDFPNIYSKMPQLSSSEVSTEQNFSDLDLDSFEKVDVSVPTKKWIRVPLPEHRDFDAIITCVDYDGFIYLHYESREADLNMLKNGLDTMYGNSEPEPQDNYWFPGEPCIVQYTADNSWYRGEVVETVCTKSAQYYQKYRVYFVDYGNSEDVDYTHMRKNLNFEHLPVLCYRCQLYNVEPATENGKWDEKVLNFINKTYVDKKVKVSIREKPIHEMSLKVSILTTTGDMSENLLVFDTVQSTVVAKVKVLPMELDYRFEERDFEMPYAACPLPEFNQKFRCSPLFYESPAMVCIRRAETKAGTYHYQKLVNSQLKELEHIHKKLCNRFNKLLMVDNPKLGDAVCCHYSPDNLPYRGVIRGRSRNSANEMEYTILFVDFGHTESVKQHEIRKLPEGFCRLPMQAILCKLHQVCLPIGEKRIRAEERLRKACTQKSYYFAVLKELGDPVKIDLLHRPVVSGDYVLVYQDLINEGLISLIRNKSSGKKM